MEQQQTIHQLANDPEVRRMAIQGARHFLEKLGAEPTPVQSRAIGVLAREFSRPEYQTSQQSITITEVKDVTPPVRRLSPAARKRMAAAQRQRWAVYRARKAAALEVKTRRRQPLKSARRTKKGG